MDLFSRFRHLRPRARQLFSLLAAGCVIGLVALAGLNAGYAVVGAAHPATERGAVSAAGAGDGEERNAPGGVLDRLSRLPLPVPEPFLEVVRFQSGQVSGGNNVYFAGETSRQGWWFSSNSSIKWKMAADETTGLQILQKGFVVETLA